jgi:3-hydroxybutyryl-CoA dehydratase
MAALTLAELVPGRRSEIEVPITVADVDAFAAISGDTAPLHMNEDFAKSKGFDGRVAHGLLLGALVSRFIGTVMPGDHGVLRRVEMDFRHPVVPPDLLKVQGEIEKVSEGTGQVTLQVKVIRGDGTVAAVAKALSMVRG